MAVVAAVVAAAVVAAAAAAAVTVGSIRHGGGFRFAEMAHVRV